MADSPRRNVAVCAGTKFEILTTVFASSGQGDVASVGSSPPSPTIDVPFSNKNDIMPPGTSLMSRFGPSRDTLSRSTASRRDDMRLFDSLELVTCGVREDSDRESKPQRI